MNTFSNFQRNVFSGFECLLPKLGYKECKDYQKQVIEAYLSRKDVLLSAPCGSGKSLCFEVAPYMFQYLDNKGLTDTSNIIIVVQPLIGLMREQVEKFRLKNLQCCYIGQEGTEKKLKNGGYNLIFSSPESLLTKHTREMLLSPIYQSNIRAVFVDESHCIRKWGTASLSSVERFREVYGRLGEVRSLMPTNTPMVSLTATANLETRKFISYSLCLIDPHVITIAPNKDNIRYSKQVIPNAMKNMNELSDVFSSLIDDISVNGRNAERVLIFCHTTDQATKLYNLFSFKLKEKQYHKSDGSAAIDDDRNRYFAQFHKTTDPEIKDTVIKSFGEVDGILRVLFATVAFGMGMDVKGLYHVVHLGPPEGIDDYVQESGRGGRDVTKQCYSVVIQFNGCTRRCNEDMRAYMTNTTLCRRDGIGQYFDNELSSSIVPAHNCCDICAISCTCQCKCKDTCTCLSKCINAKDFMSKIEFHMSQLEYKSDKNCFPPSATCNDISTSVAFRIRLALMKLRDRFSENVAEECLITGLDLSTGFHKNLIDHIVRDSPFICDLDMMEKHFGFFKHEHAVEAFAIVQCILSEQFDSAMSGTSDEIDSDIEASVDESLSQDETSSGSNVIENRLRHGVVLDSTIDTDSD